MSDFSQSQNKIKLKLGEHILTLKNLVTGYKIKEEYDDINHLLTILHIKKLSNAHV
jgi:hypothetical protein